MGDNGNKRVWVGPKMLELLEKQMIRIEKQLYGIRKSSYSEAGEIIAMKFNGEIS